MLLVSFLKLIETIFQQWFSQFSRVFPLLFQYKIYYNFTIDLKWRTGLKWWPWTSTIKAAMCLRLGFGWYKMWIIYVKFWVDTLVLIRVSLAAANCAWPWLNIISKKGAYQGTSSPSGQALFNWCLYWGDATDLTWLDNWLLSEGIWFIN